MLTWFNKKKKYIYQILYIIVGALCPASLKRFVFYKVPPCDKRSLLWLASSHSALWLDEHHKHESEIVSFSFQNKCKDS